MPTELRAAPPVTFDRSLKLETLIRLRWFAVIGQTGAILGVYWGLSAELPLDLCLLAVAASAWLNIALRLRYPRTTRLSSLAAGLSLAWDVVQLAILLHLTGGLEKSLLVPLPRAGADLGHVAAAAGNAAARPVHRGLRHLHRPVPPAAALGVDGRPAPAAALSGRCLYRPAHLLLFIGMYVWQVAEEQRQFTDALTATELVLAREQHLNQLDGLRRRGGP